MLEAQLKLRIFIVGMFAALLAHSESVAEDFGAAALIGEARSGLINDGILRTELTEPKNLKPPRSMSDADWVAERLIKSRDFEELFAILLMTDTTNWIFPEHGRPPPVAGNDRSEAVAKELVGAMSEDRQLWERYYRAVIWSQHLIPDQDFKFSQVHVIKTTLHDIVQRSDDPDAASNVHWYDHLRLSIIHEALDLPEELEVVNDTRLLGAWAERINTALTADYIGSLRARNDGLGWKRTDTKRSDTELAPLPLTRSPADGISTDRALRMLFMFHSTSAAWKGRHSSYYGLDYDCQ